MSMSGLIFLLIWGLLIVLVLVLLWHPQRSKKKENRELKIYDGKILLNRPSII